VIVKEIKAVLLLWELNQLVVLFVRLRAFGHLPIRPWNKLMLLHHGQANRAASYVENSRAYPLSGLGAWARKEEIWTAVLSLQVPMMERLGQIHIRSLISYHKSETQV
jgi:hypothetical protein